MRILITGASGSIGQILAEGLAEHDLVLWSRAQVAVGPRVEYSTSGDLRDVEWWQKAQIPPDVDVVIHLAEPVKTKLSEAAVESIIASHSVFLDHACTNARLVIYPNTAYRYDYRVRSANLQYLRIKSEVARRFHTRKNFVSPVIHPLTDAGGALARLIKSQSHVPLFNPFCSFQATIPVLTVPRLIDFFRDQISGGHSLRSDWYAGESSIAALTDSPDRSDWPFVSKIIKSLLTPLSNAPTISLLLRGRDLRNDAQTP